MATINSILGELDTSELGFTLTHEHIWQSAAGVNATYPEFFDREAIVERAVALLREARDEGVRTAVDVTTMDLGRDIVLTKDVAERSGVNIIAATGFWTDIPRIFWGADPDEVAALFVREIEDGIEGTGIKAGIIKVASNDSVEDGLTPAAEVVLRAASRASRQTGVRITTHTQAPVRTGDLQVAVFESEGVDLSTVCIGHSNGTTDLDYLTGLAAKGVWLGLDIYPGGPAPQSLDWEQRTEVAKQLIDAGYADQIMLSHDWCVIKPWGSREAQEQVQRRNPDGYLFITRRVLPRLIESGCTQEMLDRIMTDNPRRFFEGS
ncbi:MAG TPA: phosphotriesterase-related protein [Dehalococcoidia bacterium]|jgi:phosphotriesterase-related protein|nr:phosphotriesterase-related protein [SAR202 cluster bacterium]HAL49415.1 phosphotriesterase-related protein [Dehalococcoidia bacterium]|tara:strand:- start:436 stop:1398 length:963 start_codon:yes stop_codon:yes gene_type:complete